jgi:CRP-like cAMP-binding protein
MADDTSDARAISRTLPDGRRIIVGLFGPVDPAGDEEMLDKIEADMNKRRLHAVDDPE